MENNPIDIEKVPTLEEDMAAFPDKTEEEVKVARKLWETDMIRVNKTIDGDVLFVLRRSLIQRSTFLALRLPLRSWPLLTFDKLLPEENELTVSHMVYSLWGAFQAYVEFIYTGLTPAGTDTTVELMALLAELWQDSIFFNHIITSCFDGHLVGMSDSEQRGLVHNLLIMAQNDNVVREAHRKYRLLQFLIDHIVWDSIHGRPKPVAPDPNHVIRRFIDESIQNFKNSPNLHPPYHATNWNKYLLPIVDSTFVIKILKTESEAISGSVKDELSPAGEATRGKRAQSNSSSINNDVKVEDATLGVMSNLLSTQASSRSGQSNDDDFVRREELEVNEKLKTGFSSSTWSFDKETKCDNDKMKVDGKPGKRCSVTDAEADVVVTGSRRVKRVKYEP